jgi:hypothetical protein
LRNVRSLVNTSPKPTVGALTGFAPRRLIVCLERVDVRGLVVAQLAREAPGLRAHPAALADGAVVERRLEVLEREREVQDVGVAAGLLCERAPDERADGEPRRGSAPVARAPRSRKALRVDPGDVDGLELGSGQAGSCP